MNRRFVSAENKNLQDYNSSHDTDMARSYDFCSSVNPVLNVDNQQLFEEWLILIRNVTIKKKKKKKIGGKTTTPPPRDHHFWAISQKLIFSQQYDDLNRFLVRFPF